ncbi:hypothetical protein JKP88DRAFT_256689 [Tribonema minus]|uniref:Uncharacterized protein n=1 Tax=Tribonema minus TaxID=303371 RepID=A0A835YPT0_9STRA|nr:hypothetical protein JKP88DRAFT_256689 [Tribonema minus]
MAEEEALLRAELESGDYVETTLHPDRSYFNPDVYTFDYPRASDYAIGILVDPCKGNAHNCCMRSYGAPEYRMLRAADGNATARAVAKLVHAAPTDILRDVTLIDEDGQEIDPAASCLPDDETAVDDACTAADAPDAARPHALLCTSATAARATKLTSATAAAAPRLRPAGTASCTDGYGNTSPRCVAVAIAQTAMSVACGGAFARDPRCGTFLEVHVPAPNDYARVDAALAEARVPAANATGYVTTAVATTWRGNASRVLCAYELADAFPGASVLIGAAAPRCCAPRAYSQLTRTGAFFCPDAGKAQGAFAPRPASVAERAAAEEAAAAYPYCPRRADDVDVLMGAGLLADDDARGCGGGDAEFSFRGRVGTVVEAPTASDDGSGVYRVTFNGGRTDYAFEPQHVALELDYNYELWWVQRTRSALVVQKRKPFTVTAPRCTFDAVNNQYFPYAELDADGVPID